MIPKIIHFCWFGGNEKSPLIQKCIESWKIQLRDYTIIEWNEENFDINSNQYVKEAYDYKKWAFVSDYVRLWALNKYGGIYLDTDVEVFKSFNQFLEHSFFSGFENYLEKLQPITAVMGAEQNNPLVAELLKEYHNIHFIEPNGSFNMSTNTERISNILINKYHVDSNSDRYQKLGDDIHIYPSDFFCNKSDQSYSVHHFSGSWLPLRRRLINRVLKYIRIVINLFK